MKNIIRQIYLVSICGVMIFTTACQKQFLEKPTGSDLNVDSIFTTKQKALGAVAQAYSRTLAVGFPFYKWILVIKNTNPFNDEYGLLHGTVSNIADESYYNMSWSYDYSIISGGMLAEGPNSGPLTEDGYIWNWVGIRACYLVIENIDKVSDMSDSEKEQVKAEMKTLIAYRYEEMLKRYGGVPITTKALTTADDIMIPRASIQEMVTFIETLCDEAAAVLPDSYPDNMKGRITKGIALSVKAETNVIAARPLFNSASPYMSLGGENDKFICYGNYDGARWEKAIQSNQAVIDWAASNGYYLINTGNPIEDYGKATSELGNPEIILAYKYDYTGSNEAENGMFEYYNPHGGYGKDIPISFRMLSQYYKADGTDQTWAGATPAPFMEYFNKCDEMEPRFKASVCRVGGDAANNPGDLAWSYTTSAGGIGASVGFEGCGQKIKFWANSGNRKWMEFPIYRLAENYLNLAEAYNESGNSAKALENLNIIRQRAGIPAVNETNKDLLRKIIQREWAVEFFEESHRLYDIKHWKIAPEIMGAPRDRFKYTLFKTGKNKLPTDFDTYFREPYVTGFWSPNQYLVPFPVKEINKGYLVQNPGY